MTCSGGRSSAGHIDGPSSDRSALDVDTASATVTRLREDRERLAAAGPPPGRGWCEAWSSAVDAALVGLARAVSGDLRWCLAAIGGYGRRELCPGSDVDVLVLHDGADHDTLESVVRTVVYPLWDAGL